MLLFTCYLLFFINKSPGINVATISCRHSGYHSKRKIIRKAEDSFRGAGRLARTALFHFFFQRLLKYWNNGSIFFPIDLLFQFYQAFKTLDINPDFTNDELF